MQKIRYLDKLIDELAKGKPIETILRVGGHEKLSVSDHVEVDGIRGIEGGAGH
jgi:hypothetical protein